jgi:adenylate cyclase
MSVKIDYGDGVTIEAKTGSSVLEASLGAGIDHACACAGKGRCTTCRIRVEGGHENCPAPGPTEVEALALNGLKPLRLACQLRPTGPVAVRILIHEHRPPSRESPAAVEEQVAVLFSDLRGFTGFAESHLPFDASNALNRYFDAMGVLIEQHDGHILDYLGDGIMTLFRPASQESPSQRAIACALAMRERARFFSAHVWEHFGATLSVGVAVHTGRAVVGQLGYFRDRQLNAVGDVLNLTARLEDLNPKFGTDILLTQEIVDACSELPRLGRQFSVKVRGRSAPIAAWEVLGPGAGVRTSPRGSGPRPHADGSVAASG